MSRLVFPKNVGQEPIPARVPRMNSSNNTEAVLTTGTYWVPSFNVEGLDKNIKKLQRRATKLGCEAITLTTTGAKKLVEMVKVGTSKAKVKYTDGVNASGNAKPEDSRVVYSYDLIEYAVGGTAPQIAGWELMARIEHFDARNFVYVVPGMEAPSAAYTYPRDCGHCNNKRLRKDTFLVRNVETGEVKQVGSTCLRDFLGHTSPENILKWAEYLTGFTKDIGCMTDPDGEPIYGVIRNHATINAWTLVATVVAVIRVFGWVSGKAAYESGGFKQSSKETAFDWIFSQTSEDRERFHAAARKLTGENFEVSDKCRAKAIAAIEWAGNLEGNLNDYQENLKTAATIKACTYKSAGILASVVVAYDRHLENETNRAEASKGWAAGFAGAEKDRKEMTLEVTKIRSLDSDYGPKSMIQFRNENGQQVVWFCASRFQDDAEVGKVFVIKATIKKLDNYKGTDQTVITRGTLIEEIKTQDKEIVAEKDEKLPLSMFSSTELSALESFGWVKRCGAGFEITDKGSETGLAKTHRSDRADDKTNGEAA